MELLGNWRDFQAPGNNFRKFPKEEEASLDHAQHFRKLSHQQMKVAHRLGKAMVHYRQLRSKLLLLATPYLDTIQLAQNQHNEQATENGLLELEYWEKFGEGRIYKVMLRRAKEEAQQYYQDYQDIVVKLAVLREVLKEQNLQVGMYPSVFLDFAAFQNTLTKVGC